MRVCMEPRLLPGVRCSVLKTVKSWPSCWMTMPGRSCVALTLLICSLRGSISKIQAGQKCSRIRNESRPAGEKPTPSAKQQYKSPHSKWSIRLLLWKSPVTSYPPSEVEVCESEEAVGEGDPAGGGDGRRAEARNLSARVLLPPISSLCVCCKKHTIH